MNGFCLFLDKLIIALNAFASLQRYKIIKKCTKTSKKGVFWKAVLIHDRGKKYIDKSRNKQDTSSWKTNCPFNIITVLEEKDWTY